LTLAGLSALLLGLVLGVLIGVALARFAAARASPRASSEEGRPPVDVSDVMRQLLDASGRRAMVPVILRLLRDRLDPAQAAVFVSRPDGKLALADAFGLPETLGRGFEVSLGEGPVGEVGKTRREWRRESGDSGGAEASHAPRDPATQAGLRADLAVPILAGHRFHGVLAVGGSRRPPEEQAAVARLLAELSGLALLQVDKVKAIQDTANRDGLTGVFNKRYFQEHIASEIRRAERDGNGVSLLLVDIDHFKNYNDTSGHVAGDEVLKQVGQLLRGSIREDDVVARYGGEEFVVLYPGASKALAYRLAQGLRRAIESHPFAGGEHQPLGAVTISGGVASYPQDAQGEVDLIRSADEALYQAKKAGRNRIVGAGGSDPALPPALKA
jgi:diguanylate cyclase (GGDEF)-like protein